MEPEFLELDHLKLRGPVYANMSPKDPQDNDGDATANTNGYS